MTSLPTALYTSDQVKALDQTASQVQGIDSYELMQRAGSAAFNLLLRLWPSASRLTVFCGGGNNGGDGYVVASLAAKKGLSVTVFTLSNPESLVGDALLAYQQAKSQAISISAFATNQSLIVGIIVDSLLGIGVRGEVRETYAEAIDAINQSERPILAIDVPSGICADTGKVLGKAVEADCTISFVALKQGLFTNQAPDYCGTLYYDALDIDQATFDTQSESCSRLSYPLPLLPKRPLNAHKGMFGRVLVIGGDRHYGGAGIMAAEAALITGAGLVSLATQPEHISAALSRRPELMASSIESPDQLTHLVESAEVLVLGPGVGQSAWSKEVVECGLKSALPSVIDADGLNLLATRFSNFAPRDNWILTPHPAEAARLLGVSTAQIQADRFAAARSLQETYGGVVALKGAGTIIADSTGLFLCSAGNPAMSTPGMGDVLSGIIGGLLAQGHSLSSSAKLGVWAHATAADKVGKRQGKHMFATDIYSDLSRLW